MSVIDIMQMQRLGILPTSTSSRACSTTTTAVLPITNPNNVIIRWSTAMYLALVARHMMSFTPSISHSASTPADLTCRSTTAPSTASLPLFLRALRLPLWWVVSVREPRQHRLEQLEVEVEEAGRRYGSRERSTRAFSFISWLGASRGLNTWRFQNERNSRPHWGWLRLRWEVSRSLYGRVPNASCLCQWNVSVNRDSQCHRSRIRILRILKFIRNHEF